MACIVVQYKTFSNFKKAACLNLLVQGGQLYLSFPSNKDSLPSLYSHVSALIQFCILKQTEEQMDKQMDSHTDGQTDRQTDGYTDGQTERWIYQWIGRQMETLMNMQTVGDR